MDTAASTHDLAEPEIIDTRAENIAQLVALMRSLPEEARLHFVQSSKATYALAQKLALPPRQVAASVIAVVAGLSMVEVGDPNDEDGFNDFATFAIDALEVAIVSLRSERGWRP